MVLAGVSEAVLLASGAVVNAVSPEWGLWIWVGVLAGSVVLLIFVGAKLDQRIYWQIRGGAAGNRHAPYQIDVQETSEVSFLPFLRVAVEVRVVNGSDTPLHIRSVHLDAILRRGLTKRRQPLDFECLQLGGKLLSQRQRALASLATVPPNGVFDGWAHFHLRGDFEVDALRHFRFTIRLSNLHTLCVRFRVRETYAAYQGQSTIQIIHPPGRHPGALATGYSELS